MKQPYLEVTYRKGRPIAAYYYLPRLEQDKSVKTEHVGGGLLVDFASDGRAIGIEISSPARFCLLALNEALVRLGMESARPDDFSPLEAASESFEQQ